MDRRAPLLTAQCPAVVMKSVSKMEKKRKRKGEKKWEVASEVKAICIDLHAATPSLQQTYLCVIMRLVRLISNVGLGGRRI